MKKMIALLCVFSTALIASTNSTSVIANATEENAAVSETNENKENDSSIKNDDEISNTEDDINKNSLQENQLAKESIPENRDTDMVTITLELNGGTMSETVYSIEKNTRLNLEEQPIKENQVFVDWFTNPELTEKWEYYMPISEDMTLYAQYSDLLDPSVFSEDMLNYIEYISGSREVIGKVNIENVTMFENEITTYDYDEETGETVTDVLRVDDLRGIEYFKGLTNLQITIDLDKRISETSLESLSKLENISYIDFRASTPNSVATDWWEMEMYNSRNLSNPERVKAYEDEVLSYLTNISLTENEYGGTDILFDYTLSLTDQTFLKDWQQQFNELNFSVQNGEFPKVIFVTPEKVNKDGEVFYKISFKNQAVLAYLGEDHRLAIDELRRYTADSLQIGIDNYSGDYTEDELLELEKPLYIEFIDLEGNKIIDNSADIDYSSKFKAMDIYMSEAQYKIVLKARNESEDINVANYPGKVGSFDVNLDIPHEDTISGGGVLPDNNLYQYTRYAVAFDLLNEYTVTFDSKGGTSIDSQLLFEGTKANEPTAPTKDGYTFEGWYINESYDAAYNFNDIVNKDITIYAKWEKIPTNYNVIFNSMGGTTVEPQSVVENTAATKPTNPARDGYIFAGWFTTNTHEVEYDFTSLVNEDKTLYAKWDKIPTNYNVIFDSMGGTTVEPQSVVENTTATKPVNPTRDGYIFAGWFTTNTHEVEYDFTSLVNEDKTLYAKWDKIPTNYNVIFDSMGGTTVEPQSVVENTAAVKPANPTRDGYTFAGWFTTNTHEVEYDFTSLVNEDMTLYAKWSKEDPIDPIKPIEPIEPNEPKEPVKPTDKDDDETPTTGIQQSTNIYIALAALALISGTIVVVNKKRKMNK